MVTLDPRGPWSDTFGRLLVDGRDVASVEVASTGTARRRGLLGRDHLDGALLIRAASSVHTVGMRFPIDVAFLDRDLHVVRVVTMPLGRLGGLPRWRQRHALETMAGNCSAWGITPGSVVAVRV